MIISDSSGGSRGDGTVKIGLSKGIVELTLESACIVVCVGIYQKEFETLKRLEGGQSRIDLYGSSTVSQYGLVRTELTFVRLLCVAV